VSPSLAGYTALADHLRTATWPPKFRLHLPEKYDGMSNPSEFLQVYVTAITAAGGNTAVMATYFHVALFGPARTWLMNLAPGSIYSWEELCARFTANFASAYQQHGVEAHLHAVRQEPGETLWTFISHFTKMRGTIPHIFDASIITNSRHSAAECREIIDLAKRVSERHEQSSKDGSPPRRRPGKERVDDGEVATAEQDLGYQSPEGVLKDVITGGSASGDDS
jgi:hypothetical protein